MQTPAERHRDVSGALSRWIVLDLAKLAADYESPVTIIDTLTLTTASFIDRGPNLAYLMATWTLAISHKRVTLRSDAVECDSLDGRVLRVCPSTHLVANAFKKIGRGRIVIYESAAMSIDFVHYFAPFLNVRFHLPDTTTEQLWDTQSSQSLKELMLRHLYDLSHSEIVYDDIYHGELI